MKEIEMPHKKAALILGNRETFFEKYQALNIKYETRMEKRNKFELLETIGGK
ncbi:hypothetical protein LC087_02680 [Bacillus carboniphilus]|uniref:Fur-regulated basic protein FbpA n=1 Tax=Bacillus carboniphilus TaxID=86663 RepID=A0ABY9JUP7_9BACI|nr:hypothetical protein [Bacillus carboniphilus]WLR43132.1 hypothetical protein LC087_02680 [Bacillus carboniphilus]